ncbi:hypothetical protein Bca101_063796 [Brassica carinata]
MIHCKQHHSSNFTKSLYNFGMFFLFLLLFSSNGICTLRFSRKMLGIHGQILEKLKDKMVLKPRSSCSESAVAAGRSLRHRFRCRETS